MLMNTEKNKSSGPENFEPQPECKKIQDYVYRFSDQIGMGNFSKVFKGIHQTTNKQVAIKIIELSSLTNSRLQQLLNTQTRILKMLSHPNVIGCEEILSSVRNCYIITELCNGGDLEKKLKKVGSFKQKQIYHIVTDIYQGLKYLTKKHIVHRDIKVSNIFINNGVYKIADFGFAQISQVQFKDISVGSPIYMSPEGYISNLYGPKTDVWAFGMMLYQLVQGRTPYHDCRTQNQLKQRLTNQIDYSNFSSQISPELKNLIIQCLEINPTLRIRAVDIQNTQWMKKAVKIVNQNKKVGQKQNTQKVSLHNYKKTFEQMASKTTEHRVQPSHSNQNLQPLLKNYVHRYNNNFIKPNFQQDQSDSDHKRKHSTLDKTIKGFKDETSNKNNESGKIFYSPKNVILKFEKTLGFKSSTPSNKFDSFDIKNLTSPDHTKLINKNESLKLDSTNREENNLSKIRNLWKLDKNLNKQNKDSIKLDEKIQKIKKQKEKISTNNNFLESKQIKQQNKQKLGEKLSLANEYKNYFNPNNTSHLLQKQRFQKVISKNKNNEQQQNKKQKTFQSYQIRSSTKNAQDKKIAQKQWYTEIGQPQKLKKNNSHNHEKTMEKKSYSTPNLSKVILRPIRFVDCIGIIHYCRLSYKFACLLDEYGENDQTKQFLTAWSAQLLSEIFIKLGDCQIIFGSQKGLMNNPSANMSGETDKKKKLKDVIEQYLTKYKSVLKNNEISFISLKEASNFIYNLYLTKGHEFKQRTKDKKSYLYFALICYISILDKQTRNLMQYIYQIKNSFEGKHVQKLLNIRIGEFNRKVVQEIVGEGTQNSYTQS